MNRTLVDLIIHAQPLKLTFCSQESALSNGKRVKSAGTITTLLPHHASNCPANKRHIYTASFLTLGGTLLSLISNIPQAYVINEKHRNLKSRQDVMVSYNERYKQFRSLSKCRSRPSPKDKKCGKLLYQNELNI